MRTERSDISQVLSQMRAMREQMQVGVRGAEVDPLDGNSFRELVSDGIRGSERSLPASGFGSALKGALDSVNKMQAESTALSQAYELGEPGVDLTRVMIASQKSSLSFQAALQVRNKLVNAYQEIMNMPL